mgnify:CR=1 FL=1
MTSTEDTWSEKCSPRTWGWSAIEPCWLCDQAVLPTHVGMVLS